MFKPLWLPAVLIGFFLSSVALAAPPPGFWQNPVIKDAGAMHPLPQAAFQPEKNVTYKAVFSVTRGEQNPKDLNDDLDHVARAVNIFVSAGVPLEHLKFVVIIHGGALPAVLDNVHYKQQFGVDNPNLKIIRELETAGVRVAVCGQALAAKGYDYSWVSPDVEIALSALSTIILLQHDGYALMPM
ncbi:MAG TPA: DsrE family protein [Gammaproteobacteria bacterium]|nr:DsrE family protein [Gammaproteobacteria bacterium]